VHFETVIINSSDESYGCSRIVSARVLSTLQVDSICRALEICRVKFSKITYRGPALSDLTQGLCTASVLHLATHCSKKGYLIIRGKTHETSLDSFDMALTPTHIYDICAKIENHTLNPDIVVLSTCMAMTDSLMIDYVNSLVTALLSCGVSCVVSAICDVDKDSSEDILAYFYNALLGASELDVTRADTVPMDSLEALQAASLRHRRVWDNYYFPKRWAGYMFSGLGVDKHGPVV